MAVSVTTPAFWLVSSVSCSIVFVFISYVYFLLTTGAIGGVRLVRGLAHTRLPSCPGLISGRLAVVISRYLSTLGARMESRVQQ